MYNSLWGHNPCDGTIAAPQHFYMLKIDIRMRNRWDYWMCCEYVYQSTFHHCHIVVAYTTCTLSCQWHNAIFSFTNYDSCCSFMHKVPDSRFVSLLVGTCGTVSSTSCCGAVAQHLMDAMMVMWSHASFYYNYCACSAHLHLLQVFLSLSVLVWQYQVLPG